MISDHSKSRVIFGTEEELKSKLCTFQIEKLIGSVRLESNVKKFLCGRRRTV